MREGYYYSYNYSFSLRDSLGDVGWIMKIFPEYRDFRIGHKQMLMMIVVMVVIVAAVSTYCFFSYSGFSFDLFFFHFI